MPTPRRRGGLIGLALQEVAHRAGVAIISEDERQLGEQAMGDLRATWRELDLLGYSVLDYFSGNPSELRPEARKSMAKRSLVAWMEDAQAYRATELLIDFAFGRGVPQPRAKAAEVQRALDEFWSDSDNRILISTTEGQRAMGRDLLIQSNLFPLIFDDGDDGKVKIGLLAHDAVQNVVRDDNNRLRILYYAASEQKMTYDFKEDRYKVPQGGLTGGKPKVVYYEHWSNPKALRDEGVQFSSPPKEKLAEGRVYHLSENRTTEMAFGVPMMQRTLRWFAAYNDFQAARVDMMKAAAAFIMKRKIKGTPNQLTKLATKAMSRQSPLASGLDSPEIPMGGRAAGIMNENDMVDHEPMKLDSGAGAAVQDADMLHGMIAAGTGFPKHYLGSSDANLATATAMELFVVKRVEAFQEIFETFYRSLFDLVIERANDSGQLDRYEQEEAGEPAEEPIGKEVDDAYLAALQSVLDLDGEQMEKARGAWMKLREDYEDQTGDEQATDRDLSYEFSMPSPLRRMMSDLITAVQVVAQTFDPNNTNIELSRALLAIALGEALEVDDPADLVDRIFPAGYVDPMIAMAAQAQQEPPGTGGAGAGTDAAKAFDERGAAAQPAGSGSNYGAPMKATNAEDVSGAQEAVLTLRGRDGEIVRTVPIRLTSNRALSESVTARADESLFVPVRGHAVGLDALFDSEVGRVAAAELEALVHSTNGHNGGGDS